MDSTRSNDVTVDDVIDRCRVVVCGSDVIFELAKRVNIARRWNYARERVARIIYVFISHLLHSIGVYINRMIWQEWKSPDAVHFGI